MAGKNLAKVVLGTFVCFQMSLLCCSSSFDSNTAASNKNSSKILKLASEKQNSFVIPGQEETQTTTVSSRLNTTTPTPEVKLHMEVSAHKTGKESISHNLITDLPVGFVKNGTVDYTGIIQNALNRHSNVVFPGFPLLVNDKGLTISSNQTLTFLPGSVLVLKPSSKKTYNILNLKGVSNVVLKDPVIKGDRFAHLGVEGEYGMGIAIRGGKNIEIYNARISDCWGDGIYIGQAGKSVPTDIIIKNAFLKKNRRDGISIIAANRLVLENVYAAYTDGTKPMCGINFEPNNPDCEIRNVKVINPKTEYNGGSGIQLSIRTLLGGGAKKVDVVIVNHVDNSSARSALKVACNRKSDTFGGSLEGLVSIINPNWILASSAKALVFTTDQPDLKVHVFKAKVKDHRGILLGSSATQALLNKHVKGNLRYSPN